MMISVETYAAIAVAIGVGLPAIVFLTSLNWLEKVRWDVFAVITALCVSCGLLWPLLLGWLALCLVSVAINFALAFTALKTKKALKR